MKLLTSIDGESLWPHALVSFAKDTRGAIEKYEESRLAASHAAFDIF